MTYTLKQARLFLALPFEGSLTNFRARLYSKSQPPQSHGSDGQAIWIDRPLKLNPDLHPALAHALGSTAENETPTFWAMQAAIRDQLNKRATHGTNAKRSLKVAMPAGYGLMLKLSKSAVARLGVDAPEYGLVPIKIVDVSFYLSQTRIGQIVFELACGIDQPKPALIVDILHCLGHGKYGDEAAWKSGLGRIGSDGQFGEDGDHIVAAEQLSLFEFAKKMVCPTEDLTCEISTPRAFTYVLASTETDLTEAERRECAARLARRLTIDYSPRATLEGIEFASPFEKIIHACSLEGGAALVTDCNAVDFLKDFVKSVGETAYLKLALLAHKEFNDLSALSQNSSIYIEHDQRTKDDVLSKKIDRMIMIRERVLNFRLAHRFSIASFSANHNMVHKAWRKVMDNETMLNDIAGDVREAEIYLNHRHAVIAEENAESARHLLAKQSSWLHALLGFLAGLEGMRVVIEIVIGLLHWHTPESIAAGQLAGALGVNLVPKEHLPLLQVALEASPFLVGLLVALLTWRHARKGGESPQH